MKKAVASLCAEFADLVSEIIRLAHLPDQLELTFEPMLLLGHKHLLEQLAGAVVADLDR